LHPWYGPQHHFLRVGSFALASNTTGCNNVASGVLTLFANTIGNANTASGASALSVNTSGCFNTAYGYSALSSNTTGCDNTTIGSLSGSNITTGSCNVAIGSSVQVASATGSCQLVIGFSGADNWLTGTSTKAIKPGAGIIDCANSCGTAGQVLLSNGANAICWGGGVSGTYTFGTCTVIITNGLITSVT